MKIIAISDDRLGMVLCDKNAIHAMKHYHMNNNSVIVMLGSMAVEISADEIDSLFGADEYKDNEADNKQTESCPN